MSYRIKPGENAFNISFNIVYHCWMEHVERVWTPILNDITERCWTMLRDVKRNLNRFKIFAEHAFDSTTYCVDGGMCCMRLAITDLNIFQYRSTMLKGVDGALYSLGQRLSRWTGTTNFACERFLIETSINLSFMADQVGMEKQDKQIKKLMKGKSRQQWVVREMQKTVLIESETILRKIVWSSTSRL